MMISTSKALYKKHRYSGPVKSRKQVQAQLKRHHDGEVSRAKVWRKKSKTEVTLQGESAESAGPALKTYGRQKPIKEEATFQEQSQEISQPSCTRATLEINWPVTDPTLGSHKLTVARSTENHLNGLSGNRIVDMQHVLRWAFALEKHKQSCTCSVIEFVAEERTGFNSTFIFKCSMCNKEFSETNFSGDDDKLNTSFVWGTVSGGGYYTQASHLTNVMNIPTMGAQKLRKRRKTE